MLTLTVATPFIQVSIYVVYRWAASGSGISALQEYLWLPVEQHSYRTITTRSYNHVMSLSHEFHSNKSTSDLYVSVSQGRSVTGFIDTILFRIAPMFVDLTVAFIYFYYLFGSYMALTVSAVSLVYMWTTTKYGTMANSIRKDYNTASRKEVVYMWDSLENWQTVKYFNRVEYEQKRYGAGKLLLRWLNESVITLSSCRGFGQGTTELLSWIDACWYYAKFGLHRWPSCCKLHCRSPSYDWSEESWYIRHPSFLLDSTLL